ncbi:zinc finger protein [Theobroma cacao]|nr:zinc finger protein [Theobroma cacao]
MMPHGGQNNFDSSTNKGGSNSQIRCFTCREKGHISFACPQQRVNSTESGEKLEPVYDKYDEKIEEINIYPAQDESLVV